MNQEQNNLNQNNFNTQGNNGIPNNQPLNNQSFNQGMGFNQQPINPQPQPTPSYEQPIMQEPTPQPMNNTFESGSASNQNFNSKPPKKMNLGLIIGIVAVVAVVGVGIVFGSKLLSNGGSNNNNSETSNNNSNSDSNNDNSNEPTQSKYAVGTPVYFNVTNGNSLGCDSNNSTGTNSGCMKFYIISDNGDTIDMILNHNTSNSAWDSSKSSINGPTTALEQLKIDTNGWKVETPYQISYTSSTSKGTYTIDYTGYNARLITAEEIANITGYGTFDNKYFYFHDLSQSKETGRGSVCASKGCKYGWLYDQTAVDCTTYGCLSNSELVTFSYWTATADSKFSSVAWNVTSNGLIYHETVSYSNRYGIRPVITVLKSNLSI